MEEKSRAEICSGVSTSTMRRLPKDRAERKLYEDAIDPSHYVRNYLLQLCKNGQIADTSIVERITNIMKSDANYAIRTFANS